MGAARRTWIERSVDSFCMMAACAEGRTLDVALALGRNNGASSMDGSAQFFLHVHFVVYDRFVGDVDIYVGLD